MSVDTTSRRDALRISAHGAPDPAELAELQRGLMGSGTGASAALGLGEVRSFEPAPPVRRASALPRGEEPV